MLALRPVLAIGLFYSIAAAQHSPPKVCCQTLVPTEKPTQLVVTCQQTGPAFSPAGHSEPGEINPITDPRSYCPNQAGNPTSAYLVDDCATKCPIGVYPEGRLRLTKTE